MLTSREFLSQKSVAKFIFLSCIFLSYQAPQIRSPTFLGHSHYVGYFTWQIQENNLIKWALKRLVPPKKSQKSIR